MDTKSYYDNCEKCGRRFAPVTPGCNYCNSCMQEFPCAMPACIKNKQPDCLAKAVIPAVTVEKADGITNLANCFVHVTENNTTYYIDDKHRPMITWAGPVDIEHYDYINNPLNLRSQTCFCLVSVRMTIGGTARAPLILPGEVYFDSQGHYHVVGFDIDAYIDIIENGLNGNSDNENLMEV